MSHRLLFALILAILAAASACGANNNPCPGSPSCPGPTTSTTTSSVIVAPPVVFSGAGDIGQCGRQGPIATARLLDSIEGAVFTLGDNAYFQGSFRQFMDCYEPTWGRHKDRTFPSPGNHEYETPGAAGYFDYFGEAAGQRGLGYYTFDLGSWHILSLNSNVDAAVGSPQYAFVARDLTANSSKPCTLAYWHHPLHSSGPNSSQRRMADIYRLLYDNNADLVLAGHEHWYERFAPLNPDGAIDTARGLRQYVVGTGGADLTGEFVRKNHSEVRLQTHGVLRLTLQSGSYDATFVPVGGGVGDFSTGRCH